MSFIENIVSIFAPYTCLGCAAEDDKLLCDACAQTLIALPPRCYRCKAATDSYAVCLSCADKTLLSQVLVHAHYQGLAKDLVRRLKFERAQTGAHEVAALQARLLPCLSAGVVITHVPTATSRVRARGYDHARLLARSVAVRAGLSHRTLLARSGQVRQVGARRAERLQQLRGAFRPVHPGSIRGQHVVLVDDVLTTGATLETAAQVLLQAGAKRVSAIVFAQA